MEINSINPVLHKINNIFSMVRNDVQPVSAKEISEEAKNSWSRFRSKSNIYYIINFSFTVQTSIISTLLYNH